MQAFVNREGDVVVVELSGRVDVETAGPFREIILRKFSGQKLVFDFQKLGFVGSSGILPFLETLQRFSEANPEKLKFSSVGVEFRRVFAATPLNTVKVYETSDLAMHSYANPQISAVELVPLNEQSAALSASSASAVASYGYLSFGALAEEMGASSSSAETDDDDENQEANA